MEAPWWQTATVYQIYPRSFADGNGDGIGDLTGLRRRLDHLSMLGVDAVWLSPTQPSPMHDFGYDISDFCDIDPVFGDLALFDELVAAAHERGIRMIMDWVPNHTSSEHPWFRAARTSRDDPHRDFYVWSDGSPDSPPNNWVRAWGGEPAWTWDESTGQWYLHCFLPEQPDLDWSNPAVESAMHDVMRFWLDRGVDGFRMDVVHLIGKHPDLEDDPEDLAALSHVPLNDRPEVHPLLRGIRGVLDSYPGERTSIGEVVLLEPERVATYYGDGDELHLSFNFSPMFGPWDPAMWRHHIATTERTHNAVGAWPTWVLSNHDVPRYRTRYGGSEELARSAAVLLLGLRGTPFIYMGDELGLEDAEIPDEVKVDPGGRDGCRAPIPWTTDAPHGWDGAEPWLPWSPSSSERSAEAQLDDPSSMLSLYRRMISLRRSSPALLLGDLELIEGDGAVVAWHRHHGDDHRVVAVNFSDEDTDADLDLTSGPTVELSSLGRDEGTAFGGALAPNEAVVLRFS